MGQQVLQDDSWRYGDKVMNTELTIDAIDVEPERICECGRYCDKDWNCPSDACTLLTSKGYKEDEILAEILNRDGFSIEAVERMNINIKNAKKHNPELFY